MIENWGSLVHCVSIKDNSKKLFQAGDIFLMASSEFFISDIGRGKFTEGKTQSPQKHS